jgi:hypothetical protein
MVLIICKTSRDKTRLVDSYFSRATGVAAGGAFCPPAIFLIPVFFFVTPHDEIGGIHKYFPLYNIEDHI